MKKMLIGGISLATIAMGMLLFGDSTSKTATPLLEALRAPKVDETEIAKILSVDTAQRVKERSVLGNTPLFVAAYRDLAGITKLILDVPETERTTRNYAGDTILHIVRSGSLAKELLKDERIRPLYNSKNRLDQTPLHFADNESLAKVLLDLYPPNEADRAVNLEDDKGNTPLFYARTTSFANFMQKHGARLNVVNDDNQTPLVYVLQAPTFELTKVIGVAYEELLTEEHQKVATKQETRKEMALFFIDRSKGTKVTTYTGDSVNYFDVTDNKGNTALHYVVLSDLSIPDKKQIIEKLLAAGARKDIKNHEGETALDIAKKLNVQDSEQLLPLLS